MSNISINENLSKQPKKKILFISFNYNSEYFSIGLNDGFKIYKTHPFSLTIDRKLNGGIGIIEMLKESNIFCLVGGGSNPKYKLNKLLIWDDSKCKNIQEFRFNSFVKNCKIKLKKIFVVCEESISIIEIGNFNILETIQTIENPNGICAISHDPNEYLFAWPDFVKGNIEIKNYKYFIRESLNKNRLIKKVHESYIEQIEINYKGDLIATASDKGTIIRVFKTENLNLINEFRRGNMDAKIYSICFDNKNKFIAVASDKQKIHIFSLEEEKKNKGYFNTFSKFVGFGDILNRSVCYLLDEENVKKKITFYGNDNCLISINYNGNYIMGNFYVNDKFKNIKKLSLFN